ncbi:hypothetical protein QVA66_07925 [Staphylococcus chromogenes]|nr:hypothetical protein [Staphylococcus chromogenes]
MRENISDLIPLTHSELRHAGTSRKTIRHRFTRIGHSLYLNDAALARPTTHQLPLLSRAIGLQKRCPNAVLSGWVVLAAHGVLHIDDSLPVHYYTSNGKHRRDFKLNLIPIRSTTACEHTVEVYGHPLRLVGTAVAVIDCLRALKSNAASWWVPRIEGFSFQEVRMLQVIDMARTWLGLTKHDLAATAHQRFPARLLRKLWKLSDAGAQSPQETSLRLIVRDLARWESQVALFDDHGNVITTADLADRHRKVALFYDGVHHLSRQQRDYDSFVWQQLRKQGWEVVRITHGQLRNPGHLRELLLHLLRG